MVVVFCATCSLGLYVCVCLFTGSVGANEVDLELLHLRWRDDNVGAAAKARVDSIHDFPALDCLHETLTATLDAAPGCIGYLDLRVLGDAEVATQWR